MEITIEYKDDYERETIINNNLDKYLIAEKNIADGNFLIFTNTKPVEIKIFELNEDINDVAELTAIVAMDKDELAEMLVFALQRIDELEVMING